MNTVIGIIIGAIVLAAIIYAFVSKNSYINQQMKATPVFMKAIGAIIFLVGVVVAVLAGVGGIGLGGTGNADWVVPVASLGLGSVFGLLFAISFGTKFR